ncbi:MAG: hypothetical protein LBV04_08785 [Deferribacteraceae bacterium]|jgi:hypothetical protein|nr:hypothetical protein [Deferribacteraceae bacterium]
MSWNNYDYKILCNDDKFYYVIRQFLSNKKVIYRKVAQLHGYGEEELPKMLIDASKFVSSKIIVIVVHSDIEDTYQNNLGHNNIILINTSLFAESYEIVPSAFKFHQAIGNKNNNEDELLEPFHNDIVRLNQKIESIRGN